MYSLKRCKTCGSIPTAQIQIDEYSFLPDTVNLFIACNCERTIQEKRFEVGRNGNFLSLLLENIEMVVSDWNRRNAE